MPVIHIKAVTQETFVSHPVSLETWKQIFYIQDKQEVNKYECPVYKTRQRGKIHLFYGFVYIYNLGPTYIWTFNLKTKEKTAKWVLAGVALLLQI